MKNDKNIDRELVSTDARYVSKAIFKKSRYNKARLR